MGRTPCCEKIGLKKGPWTSEEDDKLLSYIQQNGHGSWRALPLNAGLQRCGKSCRLRWTNYLRPDIKRGKFTSQEEHTIIQLHALLGNRWSAIATHLQKRTDNEIKNYWNTHLKKRLSNMGIDPVTHKPKNGTLLSGPSKNSANLSHMAQWENARLEAEARLVRQSKLRSPALDSFQAQDSEFPSGPSPVHKHLSPGPYPDVLKEWTGGAWAETSSTAGIAETSATFVELIGEGGITDEEKENDSGSYLAALRDVGIDDPVQFTPELHEPPLFSTEWASESMLGHTSEHVPCDNFAETFTDLLLRNSCDEGDGGESGNSSGSGGECCEGNRNYWDSILNLVNSSPSDSPIFE
ncbi:hypothetical protein ACP275_11G120700 [Erythranthe tilingii]